MKTMWIIMATFLPGYLPSVLRGEMSKKFAPLRLAMACGVRWETSNRREGLRKGGSGVMPNAKVGGGWDVAKVAREPWQSRPCEGPRPCEPAAAPAP